MQNTLFLFTDVSQNRVFDSIVDIDGSENNISEDDDDENDENLR